MRLLRRLGDAARQPAEVLYTATDVCFPLEVPRYYCQKVGSTGGYAPKSFVVDCFPASPLASRDMIKASSGQPARWIDIQLLQFFDGLVFRTRQAVWQSLAKVLHEQGRKQLRRAVHVAAL